MPLPRPERFMLAVGLCAVLLLLGSLWHQRSAASVAHVHGEVAASLARLRQDSVRMQEQVRDELHALATAVQDAAALHDTLTAAALDPNATAAAGPDARELGEAVGRTRLRQRYRAVYSRLRAELTAEV